MAALEETCQGQTDLIVGLDLDDPKRREYQRLGVEFMLSGELHQVVAWMNWMARAWVKEYRLIGHIGDDNVPRTIGWDLRVMEALEEVPMCFADDLYPRPKGTLPCHIFMRSEIIRSLGYMGPPLFRSMFVDNVWMAWGAAIGIKFLSDVVIEHMHPGAGKAPIDETYARSAAQFAEGHQAYQHYMATDYASDVARLMALQPA
jgi:hypothetical protein